MIGAIIDQELSEYVVHENIGGLTARCGIRLNISGKPHDWTALLDRYPQLAKRVTCDICRTVDNL